MQEGRIQIPEPVGYWVIGNNIHWPVLKKPNWLHCNEMTKKSVNNCGAILFSKNGIGTMRDNIGKVKSVKKICDTYSKERVKEALKNVKKRMKSAAKFKGFWSDEFIVIEHLQSALSKKKISQKTKYGHKEYTKQAPFENHIRNRKKRENQKKEPSFTEPQSTPLIFKF